MSAENLGRSFRSSGSQLTSMPTSWSSMCWSLDAGPKRADFEQGHIASAVFADLDVDLSSPASTDDGRHPLPTAASFAGAIARLGISDNTKVVAYDDAGGCCLAIGWMLDALGRSAAVARRRVRRLGGPGGRPASPAPAVFSLVSGQPIASSPSRRSPSRSMVR